MFELLARLYGDLFAIAVLRLSPNRHATFSDVARRRFPHSDRPARRSSRRDAG
jgi:hypothetical protein